MRPGVREGRRRGRAAIDSSNDGGDPACTIVIDGFPNTGKREVARTVVRELARKGLSASLRYDVPSAEIFDGGLLERCSLRSAMSTHERFLQARMEATSSISRALRSRPSSYLVTVRDPASTRLHTSAHLAIANRTLKTDADLLYRTDVREAVLGEYEPAGRTLRYFLVCPEDEAVESHLALYGHRDDEEKRTGLRARAIAFTRALGLGFLRETDGLFCDYSGVAFDDAPYQNSKMVCHKPGHSCWTAWQIKQDVGRELGLDCYEH